MGMGQVEGVDTGPIAKVVIPRRLRPQVHWWSVDATELRLA